MDDWAGIARRCREALLGVDTAFARLSASDEAGGVSTGTITYGAPGRWHIDWEGRRQVTCVGHRLLIRAEGRPPREERVETPWAPGKHLAGLGWGEPDLFRHPAAYARALGDVGAGEVAGRACHQVSLGGAPGRPGPLDVSVDRQSHLLLAWHDRHSGLWARVDELILDGPVDADPFALPEPDRRLLGTAARRQIAESMADGITLPHRIPDSHEHVSWSLIDGDPASGAYLAAGRLDDRRRVELIRQPTTGPADLAGPRDWPPRRIMSWTEGDFTFELLLE